jgi:hypothetical protein
LDGQKYHGEAGVKRQQVFNQGVWVGLIIYLVVAASFVSSPLAKEERNPVREEMAALDLAFKGIIDAVVLGEMSLIPPALGKVQEAREKRDDAVKAGFPSFFPNGECQDNWPLYAPCQI